MELNIFEELKWVYLTIIQPQTNHAQINIGLFKKIE